MASKVGDVRWSAWIDDVTGKIEFEEWVCRTVRRRKSSVRALGLELRPTAFWVQRIKGLTWVKLSTKHFDWGFCKYIPDYLRVERDVNDPPYSTTKKGALRALAAETRWRIKRYGADTDQGIDEDGNQLLTNGEQLKRIVTAQKRLKAKRKS